MNVRRLLVLLLVVSGLLVVADRVAVAAAQRDVARRIQTSEHLSARPDVHIGGFPFLTQLVSGHYDDVDVTVHGLEAGPLAINRLTAHLSGVRVPFSDVVGQRVGAIPTDRTAAELLITYDDLNRFVSTEHVRLGPGDGGRLHVEATADVAGHTLSAGSDVPVVVSGSVLTIDVAAGVVDGLQLRIPLPGLPFHTRLNTAKATQEGIVVGGSADDLVLRP